MWIFVCLVFHGINLQNRLLSEGLDVMIYSTTYFKSLEKWDIEAMDIKDVIELKLRKIITL